MLISRKWVDPHHRFRKLEAGKQEAGFLFFDITFCERMGTLFFPPGKRGYKDHKVCKKT